MEHLNDPAREAGSGAAVLDKAVQILQAFDRGRLELTADEVAAAAGEARSTVYRYIKVLVEKGFLERGNGPHTYRPGLVLLRLTRALRRRMDLVAAAQPAMDRLARQAGETALLVVRYGSRAMCVGSSSGSRGLHVSHEAGGTFPLHAGAFCKVLLASLPEPEIEAALAAGLRPVTAMTVTAPALLRRQLVDIGARGYALSRSELEEGAGSLAVLVRGPDGAVAASLSLAAPVERITPATVDQWLGWLQAASREITARLAQEALT